MFKTKYIIKLSDTDAGGVLFFVHKFRIIHDIYEEFMKKCGFHFYDILYESDFALPIVHAEADYKKPLFVGDEVNIELKIEEINDHSFIISYFLSQKKFLKNIEVGSARTVHVAVNTQTNEKIPLPRKIRKVFKSFFK